MLTASRILAFRAGDRPHKALGDRGQGPHVASVYLLFTASSMLSSVLATMV